MQTEYILTAEEKEELSGYLKLIADVQNQMAPAMRLIIRQQHLEGNWGISPDGTKMVRHPDLPLQNPAEQEKVK